MRELVDSPQARNGLRANLENLVLNPDETNITVQDLNSFYVGSVPNLSIVRGKATVSQTNFSHYFFFVDGDRKYFFPKFPPGVFNVRLLKEKYGFDNNLLILNIKYSR